jgi:hypothetical protein
MSKCSLKFAVALVLLAFAIASEVDPSIASAVQLAAQIDASTQSIAVGSETELDPTIPSQEKRSAQIDASLDAENILDSETEDDLDLDSWPPAAHCVLAYKLTQCQV